MSPGNFVSWTTKDEKRGFGQIITMGTTRAEVAVHSWDSPNTPPIPTPGEELEVHPVIYCTLTWLTFVAECAPDAFP